MCGIGGIVGQPGAPLSLLRDALKHRGPDGDGIHEATEGDVYVGLVHTRLAIQDLSPAGAQPMHSRSGRHVLVFNGEIYNFRSLAEELSASGVVLRSRSDSEVLVEGFERYGLEFVSRCRGMFAFAIWNRDARELTLVRDRLGIRPLYVATPRGGTSLAFASELRSIARTGVAVDIDPAGLSSFLEFGAVTGPQTLLRGVELLEPGSFLKWSPRGIVRARYWSLPTVTRDPRSLSRDEVTQTTRRLLEESVALRLVSDVPVGVLLSSGLDSASIAALAAQGQRGKPLETFTITLDAEDAAIDEGEPAARFAAQLGASHHAIHLRSDAILSRIDRALAAMDQPTIDGINTYFVTEAIRAQGISVALSGLGGDEVFLGYPSAHSLVRDTTVRRLLPITAALSRSAFARRLLGITPPRLAKALDLPEVGAEVEELVAFRRRILSAPARNALVGSAPMHSLSLVDERGDLGLRWTRAELLGYTGNMLLRDTDVFGMRHPVEVRVPMLDHVLVEHLATLPLQMRIAVGRQKPLLVDAMGLDLPRWLVGARKRGFLLPFTRWLLGPLRNLVDSTLRDRNTWQSLGIEPTAVADLWNAFLRYPSRWAWAQPWALFALANAARNIRTR